MNTRPETSFELRKDYDEAVSRLGKAKAVADLASAYHVVPATVRRWLADAGIRFIRAMPQKPPEEQFRADWATTIAQHGERGATGKMAVQYGVTTTTIRQWLVDAGLHNRTRRIPARPITTPCPCGAVATTRYKGEDPPLCFRCYMRTYAADTDSAFTRTAREYIAQIKRDAICADCGGKFPPAAYHFDHVPDRGPKLFNVANCDVALDKLKAEIAKCDIVCANCHAVRTWTTRKKSRAKPVPVAAVVPDTGAPLAEPVLITGAVTLF